MNIEMEISKASLSLIRLGLGHDGRIQETEFDWLAVKALADQQEMTAVVLDGIERFKRNVQGVQGPDQQFLLQWIGEVMQNYEQRYISYEKTISSLAGFYNRYGYKMMVLKGYACSLDWPKPNHRPCGDIDIWLFGKQKDADSVLEKEKKIKIDTAHHHHTVFNWGGFMVENHYDFINVHHHKCNVELEKIFKELGRDDSYFLEVKSMTTLAGSATKVYLPSPDLHALFLLRHAMGEFAATGINLRQIIDWAFFVEKHTNEIDWKRLNEVLAIYHMIDFVNCINAICVEDLGFETWLFHSAQFNPVLKDRILDDILKSTFGMDMPRNFVNRIIFKYRRWRANAWKHQLCYKESMMSAFWSGVWNHLIKPSTIRNELDYGNEIWV